MSTPRILLDNAAEKLPSPNGVALAIMDLWDDERTSVDQLSHLVQADPALSGRLLKLANSAALGSRPVTSITEAIVKVGMKTVGQLAVAFSLIDKEHGAHCKSFDYALFWSHSLFMALICRELGRLSSIAPPEDLFSCALMSRIGLLAFATIYPQEFSDLLDSEPSDLPVAERKKFGFDHNELSAEMLTDFGVPEVLAEPAKFHEDPAASGFADSTRSAKLAVLFSLGYRLSESIMKSGLSRTEKFVRTLPHSRRLGLSADQIFQVGKQSVSEWREWSKMFELPCQSAEDAGDADASGSVPKQRDGTGRTINALLISRQGDDHPLKETLSEVGVETGFFSEQKEMLRSALRNRPQLIIIDEYDDKDKRRDKLCRMIRSTEWGKAVYIMSVVAPNDTAAIVEAFRAGVDACIPTQIGAEELSARLSAVRRLFDLQMKWQNDRADLRRIANELALSQRRMEVLSLTDQLTGLPNRRSAIAAMQQAWNLSEQSDLPMSVITIDIDHFKKVNDTFGHAAGDKVLVDVAKVLREDIRQGEGVFRMGGEEFLLLSSSADIKHLIVAAERLRRRIAALRIEHEERQLQVTISIGLAQREPDHTHFDSLLISADKALYRAKETGRNRICYSRKHQVHDLNLPRPD